MADYNPNSNMNEYRNPYNPYQNKPPKQKNGIAAASLIFGILALTTLCCFSFTTAIILGVGAVSFAIISKREKKLTTPARIAIFLGVGAVVFGVAEYFFALYAIDLVKAPENIAQFNQLFEEAEKMLENQAALKEVLKH